MPNTFFYSIFIAGFVGGKIFTWLENPKIYVENPELLFNIFSLSSFSISNKFDGGTDETAEVNGDSISYATINVGTDTTKDKVIVNLSTGADAQGC